MKTTVRHRRAPYVIAAAIGACVLAASAYLVSTPIDVSGRAGLMGLGAGARITSAGRLSLKILPHPRIEGADIGISYMGEEVMRVKMARVVLSPYALLGLKASIRDIELDGAELIVKRRPKGGFNVAGLFNGGMAPGLGSLNSLSIKNSVVSFTDEALSPSAPLDTAYISASAGRGPDGLSYSFDARLAHGARLETRGNALSSGAGLTKGSLSMDGVALSSLSPFIEPFIPGLRLDGSASIKASYSYNPRGTAEMEGTADMRGLALSHKGLGTRPLRIEQLTVPFRAESGKGKSLLTVDNAAAGVEGVRVKAALSLGIDESAAHGKTVDVRLSATPVSLTKLAAFPLVKAALKRTGVSLSSGEVSIEEMSASLGKGDAEGHDAGFKSFQLKAAFEKAGFRVKGLDSALSGISGKVSLKDGAVHVHDMSGNYGRASFDGLNGRIYGLDGPVAYELTLKTSLDAKELIEAGPDGAKTPRLAANAGFLAGLIDASGPLELDLDIKGSLRQRYLSKRSGTVGMKRVRLSYAGLTGLASGRAAFDDNAVTLDSIIVEDGRSRVRISGSITGYGTNDPAFDLTVEGAAEGLAFKQALPAVLKDLSIAGPVPFRLALKGRARDCSIVASTDLRASEVSYGGMVKKDSGYPAEARLAAMVKQGGVEIRDLRLAFGESSIRISGRADTDKPGYDFSATSERLLVHDIAHISPYLEKTAKAGGVVNIDMGVSSSGAGKSYRGGVSVRDARFSSALFERPFEAVNATAAFNGNSADIKITGLKTGGSELRADIAVTDIKERLVRFEVDSPGIDLDETLKAGAWQDVFSVKARQAGPSDGKLVQGAGVVRAERLKLKGLAMKGLSFNVELDEKETRLKDIAFGLNDGSASGALTFMRAPDDPVLFRLGMDIFDVNVQGLIKDLGAKGKVMSGDLNARVDLTGAKGKNPVSSGFNGGISLESRDGSLWKFLTLSKIFSVVNIISISDLFEDGYPYSAVTGDFLVKDGIMTTGNLMLDALSMRMSGAGEIRLPAREIDGLLGLHPFVTIDKVITNIPLAGWIIGGKEKSTVSMYYEVKGLLKDPSIEPAPIKSIEKGILGVLERLIEAPAEAVKTGS